MKLINKLTIGHLTVGLLVIVAALVGINAINSISLAFNEMSGETIPTIKALEDTKEAGLRIVVSTSEFVSIKAESGRNKTAIGDVEKQHVISGIKQYDEAISRYEDLVNRFFPKEKVFLENIKNSGKKLQNASNEIILLKEQGASGSIILEKQDEFEAAEQEFLKAINDAILNEDKEFADRNQDVNHAIAASVQNILIAGILTFIIAIALGVNISKSISKPILELKNAAVDIGKGKLDTRVDIKTSDEVGILAACFNQMAQRLEHDIEGINKVETVVRESEEKFRLVFENARDAIFWSDPETGLIVRCNKAAENLLEKENREIVGHHQSTVHSPEKAEYYAEQFKRHFKEKGSVDEEAEVITKSGKIKHVQISASVTTVRGKQIMQGIFHDITERKLAEKALIKEKEFTEIALDSQLDTFFVFDPYTNKAIRWNKTFRDIAGYTDEEIATLKAPNSYYSPEDLEKAASYIESVRHNGKARVELSLICKDGRRILTEYQASLIRDENGEPKYIISIGRDITERKLAENALKESEERYRILAEGAHDSIFIIERDNHVRYVNSFGAKQLGLIPEEIIGRRLIEFFPTEQFERMKNNLQKIFQNGEPLYCEETITYQNRKYWQDTWLMPIKDTAGEVDAVMGITRDITERKQAEEAQFKSELLLCEAERIAHLGNWEWDMQTNELQWSDETYRILGYSPGEITPYKDTFINAIYPEDKENVEKALADALENKKPYSIEHRVVRKDGSVSAVHSQGEVTFDGSGKPIKMVGTMLDITERKLAEEELKKHRDHLEELVNERTREVMLAKEEAEHANMAKTNFLQTMSHELRTPLNAIIGFSEILKQKTPGELNEKQEHFIDNIITGGNKLHNIISQILDIVQMDEGKLEMHIEKIPVPETVDELIGVISEKAEKKKVLIEKNLDPELEYIEADKQKFKQVFINLLDNAVKFSNQEGGTVTINAKREVDMAEFSVSDKGIGIKEEDMKKIFEKFTQLDSGTNRKYGGTGISLAITKQLVELHGGKIRLESRYGEGSKFIFTIPIKDKRRRNNK